MEKITVRYADGKEESFWAEDRSFDDGWLRILTTDGGDYILIPTHAIKKVTIIKAE